MPVANVAHSEFVDEVLRHPNPVLVAFRAAWCMPSVQMGELVERTAQRYADQVKVVAVDVEGEPEANAVCRRFSVTRLPVLMMFRDGQVTDVLGGLAAQETVLEMVDRELKPVRDVDAFTFEADVLRSVVPVIVHVDAAWCSASAELRPVLDSVAAQLGGKAKIMRLEFGPANAGLCARYGFQRVPTIALFHGGVLRDQILGAMRGDPKADSVRSSRVGLTPEENITEMVGRFLL
jgi:thioredoxin 1